MEGEWGFRIEVMSAEAEATGFQVNWYGLDADRDRNPYIVRQVDEDWWPVLKKGFD